MKKGFTLVELLAVIVILAIILVIAVPQIMNTIEKARMGAMESSAKLVAAAAEREYTVAQTLEQDLTEWETGKSCLNATWAGLTEGDYTNCTVRIVNGIAQVDLEGAKKFEGYKIENATKIDAIVIKDESGIEETTQLNFKTDEWDVIAENINSDAYSVGDTKCIALDGLSSNNSECENNEFLIRITNKSTPTECDGSDFSKSACGFVIEFVDTISQHAMSSNGIYKDFNYGFQGWNVDGWPESTMRDYLNSTIYNALPTKLKNIIINTNVVSGYGSSDTTNFTSTDKLYLLSVKEIYNSSDNDTAYDKTRQLDYYSDNEVTTSNYSAAIKVGANTSWWLRTAKSNSNNSYILVNNTGNPGSAFAAGSYGVSPAFRIG